MPSASLTLFYGEGNVFSIIEERDDEVRMYRVSGMFMAGHPVLASGGGGAVCGVTK